MHVTRRQHADNLAWLDLEMTGLDARDDVIVQAALIITDSDLRPLEEFACDIWQPQEALARMGPFVREMHTKTGLLGRVIGSRTELATAERMLLERVAGWCTYPALLCGNSIAHDRRFLDRWMPAFAGYLHYRLLDVTSIKLLARLWYGDGAAYAKPAEGAHDALVDVRNSIDELQHYRATLFRQG